jgi:hypothetical protein
MTNRRAPTPDALIPAEAWFVDLINCTHIAARARGRVSANVKLATKIERDAWANLARCCAAAPWEG